MKIVLYEAVSRDFSRDLYGFIIENASNEHIKIWTSNRAYECSWVDVIEDLHGGHWNDDYTGSRRLEVNSTWH